MTTPLRFITAASLFDGHDAAINIIRRLIQDKGAEVIHLGHNRSVDDVLRAAIQEGADAICLSSYQGGHNEYFKYLVEQLKKQGAGHIAVFGGGGGTITPEEITVLEQAGVERIYHPNDGMAMGLLGMVDDVVQRATVRKQQTQLANELNHPTPSHLQIAQTLSAIENQSISESELKKLRIDWQQQSQLAPVIGITGTGGAGKSSLTDEILNRFSHYLPELKIAILAVDPSRRRTGGALLGDRIRMNSLRYPNLYMRSIATRRQHVATSEMLGDAIAYLRSTYFDLVLVETAGIGQSDSEIVDLVDVSLYVMTSDFGAASQLEKIDMLDFADMVVINKFEKPGALDALRDVRKQWRRNRNEFSVSDGSLPVYPTIASQFNDVGVSWLFQNLVSRLKKQDQSSKWRLDHSLHDGIAQNLPKGTSIIPSHRVRYLSDISNNGRQQHTQLEEQALSAQQAQHFYQVLRELEDPSLPEPLREYDNGLLNDQSEFALLRQRYQSHLQNISDELKSAVRHWPSVKQAISQSAEEIQIQSPVESDKYRESLSHLAIPKVAAPDFDDWGNLLRFMEKENIPGHYPYTAGVFPHRREAEEPIRMFAGEGTPERTNRRFHYLSIGQTATRLSTAFDSVTLYGENPDPRPDIYGKVGNSGVSIATVDDMKKLYSGFDLCDPNTSVSMTINGPAPIILAFFMNAAIDQQIEKHLKETNQWENTEKIIEQHFEQHPRPRYQGEYPESHNGLGLGLLGISGDKVVDPTTYQAIKTKTLATVRGTVQADILKEDQAQNTCIFSTEFAMHMMADIQQYFIDHKVKHFYSVSISGYHIAEAGANPVSQLAFTLANGFTIAEYYLSRGMNIDDFAPNLSFFFSNGMDPEYAVIGRVARRIWARAMKHLYKANKRSQRLKYHIQTSGRSLHAQEIQFNDIRTTLQAAYALFDNCNSLHTNAYDEAITTPTEESVRRAMAIQLIINRELGLNYCENPLQGSFLIDHLTDLVEEAVYQEFDRMTERGGVLGAMDTMYQRSKIQDESMYYEHKKHDGSLPIIGVNTFLPDKPEDPSDHLELARSTDQEKHQQIEYLSQFHKLHTSDTNKALTKLQQVAMQRGNTFEELMETVKCASLGQISNTLYRAGGEYRRNM